MSARIRIRGCLWQPGVNGLGVRGFHALPYRERFDRAARRHDCNYDQQGGWQTRRLADMSFLQDMLWVCRTDGQCAAAMAYYVAVRALGWLFYRYDR